jgi:hypothetical protein
VLNHLQATHPAHQNISQNRIAGIIPEVIQSIRTITESTDNLKTNFVPGDEAFQTMSDVIFVFNNHKFEHRFTSSLSVALTPLWACLKTYLFQVSIL